MKIVLVFAASFFIFTYERLNFLTIMANRQTATHYHPFMEILFANMVKRYPLAMVNYSWTTVVNCSRSANLCSLDDEMGTNSALLRFYKEGQFELKGALTILFVACENIRVNLINIISSS